MVRAPSVPSLYLKKFKKNKESKDSTEGNLLLKFSIDSALARQVFYTTTRLGIYKTITTNVKEANKKEGISTVFCNFRGFDFLPKSLLRFIRRIRWLFGW